MSILGETSNLLSEPSSLNPLPCGQKAAYSSGHVLNDICAAMWFSYTLLFFQLVLAMPPVMAGTMLLIGQVADALATPIVGIYADRSGNSKMWHLVGSATVIFSFPLIFSPCPGCQDLTPVQIPKPNSTHVDVGSWADLSFEDLWLRGIYYSALIIIFQSGWAIVQISHLALIPNLTVSQTERAELTAFRYTASVCAGVFMYVITWLVFRLTTVKMSRVIIGPEDSSKFRDIALIGLLVGSVFAVLFQCCLKNPQGGNLSESTRHNSFVCTQNPIECLKVPNLMQVAILYVASRLFLTLSLVYIPLYLVESLGEQVETLATVPLVSYITSFLSGLSIKYISTCLSSKSLYLAGAICCLFSCIWIKFGMGTFFQTFELYMVAALFGVGSSVTTVSSLCLVANLIGKNNGNGAFVYSLVTFADKLLNGIVVILIEALKCDQDWMCPHYYKDVLAYACGGSAILGIGSLCTLWKMKMDTQQI